MPLFPSDFKKFKHVESDDKTTTLEHPHGHRIVINHKALKGPMREQLEALAKGGKVTKAMPVKKSEPMNKDCAPTMMAKGGSVEESSQQPPELDPIVVDTIKNYNRLTSSRLPGDGPAVPMMESFGPNNEPPSEINTDTYLQARQRAETDRMKAEESAIAEQQAQEQRAQANLKSIQDQNAIRQQLNLPPNPIPQELASIAQPQVQGAMPASIETPEQGLTQTAVSPQVEGYAAPQMNLSSIPGYDDSIKGINEQVDAQSSLAKDQEQAYKQTRIAEADAMNVYEGKKAMIEGEIGALQDDIANSRIDPAKFWNNRSRVAAGIGMILAGFDPAGRPNAAINFLNQEMDRDLQAQRADIGRKENLLSANMKMLGNEKDAYEMTRLMQKDMVANELQMAAAKAVNPMAKAAALKASGELKMQLYPQVQALAAKQALAQLDQTAKNDPSKMDAYLAGLDKVDPKKAEEMRNRAVPGLGFAMSDMGAKDMREMQSTVKTVRSSINRLREITKIPGKSLSPDLRAEADSLRTQLIGRLRVPLTGPGAMSEGERELLMNAIPTATDMFSLDSRTIKKLDTVEKGVVDGYRNMAIANGLKVPEASNQPQDKNAQARTWVEQNINSPNPETKRKAAAIRQALGMK